MNTTTATTCKLDASNIAHIQSIILHASNKIDTIGHIFERLQVHERDHPMHESDTSSGAVSLCSSTHLTSATVDANTPTQNNKQVSHKTDDRQTSDVQSNPPNTNGGNRSGNHKRKRSPADEQSGTDFAKPSGRGANINSSTPTMNEFNDRRPSSQSSGGTKDSLLSPTTTAGRAVSSARPGGQASRISPMSPPMTKKAKQTPTFVPPSSSTSSSRAAELDEFEFSSQPTHTARNTTMRKSVLKIVTSKNDLSHVKLNKEHVEQLQSIYSQQVSTPPLGDTSISLGLDDDE